eukprot:TRINITY_DN13739_c0_g1_i1.p1 TRINITY_DN13739_c0_g1~~TRINITY_DN13739_c0_g1_i1.p1  ORF type:complete len:457 (+),score=53.36 TRINITY_DN13739_c0_g1_i1:80-1372(+)
MSLPFDASPCKIQSDTVTDWHPPSGAGSRRPQLARVQDMSRSTPVDASRVSTVSNGITGVGVTGRTSYADDLGCQGSVRAPGGAGGDVPGSAAVSGGGMFDASPSADVSERAAIAAAAAEWDAIERQQPSAAPAMTAATDDDTSRVVPTSPESFRALVVALSATNWEANGPAADAAVSRVESTRPWPLSAIGLGNVRLPPDSAAHRCRRFVCALAATRMDGAVAAHSDLLCALWPAVTGSVAGAPGPISRRWEDLGFQGSNPATDLRAAGLLGLALPVWLGSHAPQIMRRIYIASQSPTHPFELALIGLNLAVFALRAVRSGTLNNDFVAACTESGASSGAGSPSGTAPPAGFVAAIAPVGAIYGGLYLQFLDVWADAPRRGPLDWESVRRTLEGASRRPRAAQARFYRAATAAGDTPPGIPRRTMCSVM